ncbi:MAG: hypothetical protein KDK36_16885, partial [Leptospiraceae bacterium]|nr:hypothetical protein [Leptospiraceae bacterium]
KNYLILSLIFIMIYKSKKPKKNYKLLLLRINKNEEISRIIEDFYEEEVGVLKNDEKINLLKNLRV